MIHSHQATSSTGSPGCAHSQSTIALTWKEERSRMRLLGP